MDGWLEGSLLILKHYGAAGLFILSFVESSFFPITPSLILIPLVLSNPAGAPFFVFVTVLGSVLGAVFGYAIGSHFGHKILNQLLPPEKVKKVESSLTRYGGWAIAGGGLLPFPFSVFTIAAGVFRINISTLVGVSTITRGIRFSLEALLLVIYGTKVVGFLKHSLGLAHLVIILAITLMVILLWHTQFLQDKLVPLFKKGTVIYQAGFAKLKKLFSAWGRLSWYLITGATLTAFGAIIFIKLLSELLEQELRGFDTFIAGWIVSGRVGWLTKVMVGVTNMGSTGVVLGVVLFISIYALRKRHWRDAIMLLICMAGALGLTEFLKDLIQRSRPALPWLAKATGFSFPSGHSLLTLTLYWFLAYLALYNLRSTIRRTLVMLILTLIPVLVGISRVYLGVHYPSDVLAGWAVAAGWLGTCIAGRAILEHQKPEIK